MTAMSKKFSVKAKPTMAEALAELQELYDSLPALACKGLCYDACTVIDASELERRRMAEHGVELPPMDSGAHDRLKTLIEAGRTPRCPALSPLNTCRVYEVRPLICRAFGMVLDRATGKGLMCEHGCVPEGTITPGDLYRAIRELEELSEEVTGVSRIPRLPVRR